jgi:TIR domain
VRDTLDQLGLNVWMDRKGGVEAGDLYRAKITHDIWHSTLFIPLLSKNAQRRMESFFREEWDDALRRMRRFKGSSRAFIIPMVIDDLDPSDAGDIPDEFKEIHTIVAPQGMLTNDAARHIQQMTRSIIKTEGSAV